MKPSLTIVVPAYNEAGTIAAVTRVLLETMRTQGYAAYEVLIVDDCSADETGKIADDLSRQDPHVRVVHNKSNQGIGYNFKLGWELSTSEYTGIVGGDFEVTPQGIYAMIAAAGSADIINTYIANPRVRPLLRQIISRCFTGCMNVLFGLHVRYLTGPAIIRTALLRRLKRTTPGFAFMMLILVQLLRAGYSYVEVGTPIQPRAYGKAKIFRLKDVWRVFKAVVSILHTVYCTDAVQKLRS